MTTRPRFDKAEKRFLAASLLLTGAFLCALLWWGEINTLPELQIPSPGMPSPNAFDDYKKATLLMVSSPAIQPVDAIFDNKIVPRKDWAKVYPLWRKEAWLRQNAPALQAFRQGLRRVYREPPARSFTATYPHLARFRELARVLRVASDVRAARGDWPGAARINLQILQFGHQTPHGGALISSLVGFAIQAMARRRMPQIVPHLDAATCRSSARRIEQLHATRVSSSQVFQEEKWCGQAGLIQIMHQRDWVNQLLPLSGGASPSNFREALRYRFVAKGRVLLDYTNYMDALIAAAKKPYAKAQAPQRPVGIVGDALAPAFESARFNDARSATGNLMLAAALALRAYRLENGVYPDQLAQLVPNYLSQLPIDGFGGGEPLRYKKQGDNYVLWSIGPDKRDDGGRAITELRKTANPRYDDDTVMVQADSQGDWVYGINR